MCNISGKIYYFFIPLHFKAAFAAMFYNTNALLDINIIATMSISLMCSIFQTFRGKIYLFTEIIVITILVPYFMMRYFFHL